MGPAPSCGSVLLGVGTVMDSTVSQIGLIKSLGGTFALSPIDPTGFVEECHRHGVLAIPSAFTSNVKPLGFQPAPQRCGRAAWALGFQP